MAPDVTGTAASMTVESPEDENVASLAEREKSFYNERSQTPYNTLRRWIWRAIGEFGRDDEVHELYDPAGRDVLDYGCGPGYLAQYLVEGGARSVTGIDVSDGEIEQARERAEQNGIADRSHFLVADAHATDFADDSFDLIVGAAILH